MTSIQIQVDKEESLEAWKEYVQWLQQLQNYWTQRLQQQRERVDEINYQRQRMQIGSIGPQLQEFEQRYLQAVYQRNQYQYAIQNSFGLQQQYQHQQQQTTPYDTNHNTSESGTES